MAHLIDADYHVQWLLPPALEDWVPRDHPARFIREFVDALDLPSLGFVDSPGVDGRPAFAKGLLLKIWLYGYWQGIRSHRKLERACREHLSLLWLAGLHQPDHNSLWRFWREHKRQIRQIHRQSVQLAFKAGLVSLALWAVDGTKIEAVASGHSGWTQEHLEKLLERLDRVLDEREAQIEQNAQQEQADYRLPQNVCEQQALRAAVRTGLAELEQSGRQHYHRHEPQAHRMKCGGANRYAYNAQAVADEKAGIIVAGDVTDQENDVGQLPQMLSQARELVQSLQAADSAVAPAPPAPPATAAVSAPAAQPESAVPPAVADTGYGAGADIAAAQAAGFEVVVPVPEGKPKGSNLYHASAFHFDRQADTCVCPQGQVLAFERQKNRRGTLVRVYRCRCRDCPVRTACTRDRHGRTIEIAAHHEVVVTMRQKLASPAGQALFRQRGQIIEPRFAAVKERQGFRRWTVRGLEQVKAQWQWVCTTANLQILFQSWVRGALQLG